MDCWAFGTQRHLIPWSMTWRRANIAALAWCTLTGGIQAELIDEAVGMLVSGIEVRGASTA